MRKNIDKLLRMGSMLLVLLVAVGCSPLTIEEPPVLAGDFSDPVYPKTYGRATVNVAIDPDYEENSLPTKAGELTLQFYFVTPDGSFHLAKEYTRVQDMPSVALFPIGKYVVVAKSPNSDDENGNSEYLVGRTNMEVTATTTVIGDIVCQLMAGDFSNPIYPQEFGKMSLTIDLEEDIKGAFGAAVMDTVKIEVYFLAKNGEKHLCKTYKNNKYIPAVALYPTGKYLVIASAGKIPTMGILSGQSNLEVQSGQSTTQNVSCKLFADEFSDPAFPKTFGNVSIKITDVLTQLSKSVSQIENSQKMDINNMIVEFLFVKPNGELLLAKRYDKYEMMPPVVSFPVGEYKVVAKSHDKFEKIGSYAYFDVNESLVVSEASLVEKTLQGAMRNSRLAIKLNDAFNNAFVDSWTLKATFKNDVNSKYEFNKSNVGSDIYFDADAFELLFFATQKVDKKEFKKNFLLSDIKDGSNIEVKLEGFDAGKMIATLLINGAVSRFDHNVSFPDDDKELGGGGVKPEPGDDPEIDNPQPDPTPDPDPKPDPDPEPVPTVPTVVGVGFNVDNVKSISTSSDFDGENLKSPLKVVVEAPEGINNFIITIESPDIGSELLDPIFGGTSFDLANVPVGSVLESNLDGLGILPLGTKVKGEKSFTFDLTAFMSLLPENTQTHNFRLKVVDSKRQGLEKLIQILRTK